MNITYVRKLHNRVIHQDKERANLKVIYAEDRQVQRLNENKLISICKECFVRHH